MKQENKELLLIDLCTRLPYGVILVAPNGKTVYQTDGNTGAELLVEEGWKPYLRPMSSMTEEERKEYNEYLFHGASIGLMSNTETAYELIDWLNTHHFDYRGLIERGLAIAVTVENDTYK